MVTPFLQFNDGFAVVTLLPALLLGHLHYAFGLFVLWTISPGVILAVAQDAYFSAASATTSILSSCGQVDANLGRLDPFTAAFRGAVQSVSSRVLFILLVPKSLELIVEQAISVF